MKNDTNFNLVKEVNKLYESGDYFIKKYPEKPLKFEEDYHQLAIDPDGCERHLLSNVEREHNVHLMSNLLNELQNNINGGTILDVGCGPGWLLSALDNDKWDKYGLEISSVASKHASRYGNIFNGTLEQFNTELKFDVITMNHVIEHLEDPIYAIKKIHTLLRKGGTFILGTPDFDSAAARRYGNNYRMLGDYTHISLFTSDSMHRFLRDYGFKIYKVDYPFFDTKYFTKENLIKVLNSDTISPPMYGSVMDFYSKKI